MAIKNIFKKIIEKLKKDPFLPLFYVAGGIVGSGIGILLMLYVF